MKRDLRVLVIAACAAALIGCTHEPYIRMEPIKPEVVGEVEKIEDLKKAPSNVSEVDEPYVDPRPVETNRGLWLKQITVSLAEPAVPITAAEIVRMLRAHGINLTSSLPLSSYTYQGYGVSNADALTAMTMLFGAMGLDFRVDDERRFVEVVPMGSRTWTLNIGDRKSEFKAGGDSGSTGGAASGGSGTAGGSSSGGSQAGGLTGITGTTTTGGETSKTDLAAADDFWGQFASEIENRLKVLVPLKRSVPAVQGAPGAFTAPGVGVVQSGGSSAAGGEEEMFKEIKVGRASINKTTGSITVQAPRIMLDDINQYIERVDAEYNTVLEFDGQILLVSTTEQSSRGIDIAAFKEFADGKYPFYFTNNSLGGVTISPNPQGIPVPGLSDPLSGTLVGAIRNGADSTIQVFSAYLESVGDVVTLQKPFLATTTGVPVVFSQFEKSYFNNVSETATQNQFGNPTVSRTNTLIPFDFGTALRIYPRYDVHKKVIRANISLTQILQAGTQTIQQFLSDAAGTRTISSAIPLDRRIEYHGETLLRDGDVVILGGQTIRTDESNADGIPKLRDGAAGDAFGTRKRKGTYSTYYFVMKVKTRRGPV